MALKPCRECGANVSTDAEICPHCGVRAPASPDVLATLSKLSQPKAAEKKNGCASAVAIMLVIIFAISYFGSGSKKDEPGSDASPKAAPSGCRNDWRQCADNGDLVNNFGGWTKVQVDCKIEASDRAKYGSPKWPWFAFSSYFPGVDYVKTGEVIAIEKDAQFQNGFGAMVHSRVVCRYNLNTSKVTSISILEK